VEVLLLKECEPGLDQCEPSVLVPQPLGFVLNLVDLVLELLRSLPGFFDSTLDAGIPTVERLQPQALSRQRPTALPRSEEAELQDAQVISSASWKVRQDAEHVNHRGQMAAEVAGGGGRGGCGDAGAAPHQHEQGARDGGATTAMAGPCWVSQAVRVAVAAGL
jgi:hypothetical protein